METLSYINDSIVETISFKYINGSSQKNYEPHKTGWRVFPYTVIVCAFNSEYICEIKNEEVYRIKAKEAVVVPRDTPHRMIFEKAGYLNYIHISYTIFNSIDVLSLFNTPRIIPYNLENPVYKLLDNLSECRYSGQNPFPLKKAILFKELGFSLLNAILEKSTEKENMSLSVSKIYSILPVLNFIQENIANKISRKTLADILSLSETHFHYIFKDVMKISPMKYLRNLRFQKAHILLSTTVSPINEISSAVGYSDYFNFSKQFKMYFGESPSEVRLRSQRKYTASRLST